METKYGIISDIHEDPNIIVPMLDKLSNEGIKRLIINGDIGGNYGDLEKSQGYTAFILEQIGKSGLESYVQPGSHETLLGFGPVIEYFSDKYDNILDCSQGGVISNGHDLIFVPGSDFLCGGEYQIGNDERIPSGRYINLGEGKLGPFDELQEYVEAINAGVSKGAFSYFNIQDLKKQIRNPDKTIVVGHVPRKFDNIDNCVDMAEFGDVIEDFQTQQGITKKGTVIPLQFVQPYIDAGAPVIIKKENRGNKDLRDLYEEIGIKRSVTGHFHESSHRANDRDGNYIGENTFIDELFWNTGHGDMGEFGILTIDDDKNLVKYGNMKLS